jgi:DNA-binding LacI/PurR family transcriptional regulator
MMSLPKRITIKQIAQEAGVSTQTVSRVLNQRADVASETRERVQTIIDWYGYRPSQLARGLIRGRTNTIGVITSDLHHYGPSHTLTGIAEQAHALGYTLCLSLIQDPSEATVETIIQNMLAQHVDGIIWAAVEKATETEQSAIQKLTKLPIPVAANRSPRPGLTIAVHGDSYLGGEMATKHLLEQGYRTVGHISGPLDEQSGQQRLLGWQNALRSANLSPDESLVVHGDWTSGSGACCLPCLLEQRPDIDAVFVANDQMALGVFQTARKLNRQIPQDLGVVGYDNIPESSYFDPPLTTIHQGQDLIQHGRLLVQELDRAIQAQNQNKFYDPQAVIIPPRLIIRASSIKHSGEQGGAKEESIDLIKIKDLTTH